MGKVGPAGRRAETVGARVLDLGALLLSRRSQPAGPGAGKRYRLRALLLLFLAGLPAAAPAETRPAAEQSKIDWLLDEVGRSAATFLRNGKEYDAARAVSHLKRKLFFAGKRVQTAREFIAGVASKSEETGKPYEIRFPDGRTMLVGAWLTARLSAFEEPVHPHPTARPRA